MKAFEILKISIVGGVLCMSMVRTQQDMAVSHGRGRFFAPALAINYPFPLDQSLGLRTGKIHLTKDTSSNHSHNFRIVLRELSQRATTQYATNLDTQADYVSINRPLPILSNRCTTSASKDAAPLS